MKLSSDNIISMITCLITGIIGYVSSTIVSIKPQKTIILNKQLYNVYLPLFKKIESNLYKKISMDTAREYVKMFNYIRNKHYELIDSRLCNLFFDFEKQINNNKLNLRLYSDICYRLDVLFESTKRKLKMPPRTLMYKMYRWQFPRDYNQILDIALEKILKSICILGILIIILLFILFFWLDI